MINNAKVDSYELSNTISNINLYQIAEKSDSAPILNNASFSHFHDYIRIPAYIPTDDKRYSNGNGIENRIEPPLPELAGDIFDRQRVIEYFNQPLIEKQRCLVLGVGGIGQNVAMCLARLGVGKIEMLDNDTYDPSNLTRQLLGGVDDIDKRKVDIAAKNIAFHNLRSEVIIHDCDALAKWDEVVQAAKQNDVIFNCIDIGTVFDFAVNSLSKALKIPLIQGQSAGWALNAEFYSGQPGQTCFGCTTSIASSFATEGSMLSALVDRLKIWVDNAYGNTTDRLSFNDIFDFLRSDRQYRIDGPTAASIVLKSVIRVIQLRSSESSIANNDVPKLAIEEFPKFIQFYYKNATKLLLPSNIMTLNDLLFIPRPQHVPTRYIGSWVCPCIAVAALMVSQMVNYITGPSKRDPPTSMQLSLSTGLSDIAESAIEIGFVDPPPFSSTPSSDNCATCMCSVRLVEEQLFFSMVPIVLIKADGNTVIMDKEKSAATYHFSDPSILNDSCNGVEMRNNYLWRNIDNLGPEYSALAVDAVPRRDANIVPASISNKFEYVHNLIIDGPMIKYGKKSSTVSPSTINTAISEEINTSKNYIDAFASGIRSGLLHGKTNRSQCNKDDEDKLGCWYRLKGCGMPEGGFTVVNAMDDNGNPMYTTESRGLISIDSSANDNGNNSSNYDEVMLMSIKKIRGAAYPHTANIELYMTELINNVLASNGIVCANKSIGRWDYDSLPSNHSVEQSHFSQDKNFAFPLVTRSCVIFETLGDRRLGDHVLRGLESLLPFCCDISADSTTDINSTSASSTSSSSSFTDIQTSVCSCLHATGLIEMGMGRDETTLLAELSNILAVQQSKGEYYLSSSIVDQWDEYDGRLPRSMLLYAEGANTSPSLFADANTNKLIGLHFPQKLEFSGNNKRHELEQKVPTSLKAIWNKNCEILRHFHSLTGVTMGELLAYIYWRFGVECGTIGRLLNENDIIWGAFADATGMHMNAHSNNFVLLPEDVMDEEAASPEDAHDTNSRMKKIKRRHFLGPLDFDMAYTRDTCDFGGDEASNIHQFEKYLEMEKSELGFNLAMCQGVSTSASSISTSTSSSISTSTSTGTKPPIQLQSPFDLVRLSLRDTLVKGWLTALQKKKSCDTSSISNAESSNDKSSCDNRSAIEWDLHPYREEWNAAAYACLRLALIMTWDFIA